MKKEFRDNVFRLQTLVKIIEFNHVKSGTQDLRDELTSFMYNNIVPTKEKVRDFRDNLNVLLEKHGAKKIFDEFNNYREELNDILRPYRMENQIDALTMSENDELVDKVKALDEKTVKPKYDIRGTEAQMRRDLYIQLRRLRKYVPSWQYNQKLAEMRAAANRAGIELEQTD